MSKKRILFSMPTKHHVEIALDEMTALQDLGYVCDSFHYAAKNGYDSNFGRLWIIIQNALNLVKIAYRVNPDIIYFNSRLEVLAGIRDFITILILKAFYWGRVRFLIKSHGSDIEVLANKQFFTRKIVLPFLKRNISGWLFLSTEEKQKVIATNYFPANRIFVTKNIVRTDQFKKDADFKQSLNIPEEDKVLLFVGRIIREKGIFEVIDAFSMIQKQHNVTLVIIGDGLAFAECKEKINALGIAHKIRLTGFIPEQNVVRYYANSDVLVFPTYFPEGFPMALFNSVAAGLCVITTPTRAATDFLTEPENCMWVQAQNSSSIVEALQKLLKSEQLMSSIKKNNIAKAIIFGKVQVGKELAQTIENISKL